MTGSLLGFLWLAVGAMHVVLNHDALSPGKIYHAYIGLFFGSLFFADQRPETYFIYAGILLSSLLVAVMEGRIRLHASHEAPRNQHQLDGRHLIAGLWLISIIPLLAQAYLIQKFGGFVGYFNVIGFRVREFQGLNHIVLLTKLMLPVNLAYFCLIMLAFRDRRWFALPIVLFLTHCVVTIALGLLSGSRSQALINLVWMIILYNYLRKPIGVRAAVTGGMILIALGMLLGIARNGLKWTDEGVQSAIMTSNASLGEKLARNGTLRTGEEPLDLILDQGVPEPKLGMTFLTAMTNFMPRGLWPDKPPSGGIVLTREYTGDAWKGASNLSTGWLAESMLNFGLAGGLVIGFGMMLANLIAVTVLYGFTLQRLPRLTIWGIPWLITYIYAMQYVTGGIVGEFTNGVVILVTQLVSLWTVWLFAAFVARHLRPFAGGSYRHKRLPA